MCPKELPAQVDSALLDPKGVIPLSAYAVMLSLVPGKPGPLIFLAFIKHIHEGLLKQFIALPFNDSSPYHKCMINFISYSALYSLAVR
jgi:hypothetical protein